MKLVGMLRVKDGEPFIRACLANMSELVDELVVVDNGSTDGTLELLRESPIVTRLECTHGFNEGRDRNLMYAMAREQGADWLLWLDCDEVFEPRVTRSVLAEMMQSERANRYMFRSYNFVDREHWDASPPWLWEMALHYVRLWKDYPTGHFANIPFEPGHVVGIPGRRCFTPYRVKHHGSVEPGPLERKIQAYRALDPSRERTYRLIRHEHPWLRKWREYDEAPLVVTVESLLLDVVRIPRHALNLMRRLARWRESRRAQSRGV